MSTRIMAECWPLVMPPSVKAVLISLADQASDDGVCWPAVQSLCDRTCLSERAVRKCIGWLRAARALTVTQRRRGNGSQTSSSYEITLATFDASLAAVVGADSAADSEADSEADAAPAEAAETLSSLHVVHPAQPARGAPPPCTTCTPRIIIRTNTNTPPSPPRGGSTESAHGSEPEARHEADAQSGSPRRSRERKPQVELSTWLRQCAQAGVKPIPEDDAVFVYADAIGLSRELLALHWGEFKLRRGRSRKRQADWPQTFRNSVEGNWYGLWWIDAAGLCQLTTRGRQAQARQEAERLEREAERMAREATARAAESAASA